MITTPTSTGSTGSAGSAGSSTNSTSGTSSNGFTLGGTDFLTLMLAQLKNQDPTSPVDSNQFVTQLTQYSQLEQLIGIHKDTTSLNGDVAATPQSTTGAQ